ncbi:hypothetical protein, partial [Sulfitobacter sp. CW3]|uniref:hypothetical protein n=1 Tax=Sulfitobacter sp. CW3 TaxID=2861965 RepID=UPI001C5E333B
SMAGMGHAAKARGGAMKGGGSMAGMGHGAMPGGGSMGSMNMDMDMRNPANVPPNVDVGVGVDMVAPEQQDRTGNPGLGLE